ncbi:MAG TPA: AAA family ATPase, partial [Rhodocyclaceae bacterium]|nr:AAA family ATPase [Rhodocyclaceae bacterium]
SAPRGLMTEIVAARGGHCVPLHGGVIAAYFGYPVAHEFMPRRAVETALDIMTKLYVYPDVSASMGLHTGWMLADSQLALPDVAGDITRRAGDLADRGEDHHVQATQELAAALKGFFHFEALDSDRVRVIGKTRATHRLEAADELTPLVGRREEIRELLGLWERVQEGGFLRVAIQGEPGIGKSRLLAAMSDAVVQRGGVVRALRCDADETQTPYSPLVDFLRRRYGDDPSGDAEGRLAVLEAALRRESDGLAAHLRAHLSAIAALLHLPSALDALVDVAERKRRIEASLLAILTNASPAVSCLLTVEDVHWIDPSTLGLLEQLVQRPAAAHGPTLMLVLTSRTAVSLPGVQGLTLSRLSRRHALEMAHRVAGAGNLSADRVAGIVERTDGIPLFIEQVMRGGVDGSATDIPLTLRDLLAARLATLGDGLRLAQCAAIIGREFDAAMLAHLSESPREALDRGLVHLRRSGLIVDKGEGRFSFSHALITDAAYLSLPAPERRALHLRLARLIESVTPTWAADHPETVARHLDLSAHPDATAAWLKAGAFMVAQSAFAEGLAHFESGLAALDRVQDDSRRADLEFRLRIAIGNGLMALKGYGSEESHASFLKAQALSNRLSNDADLFQLMWGLWLGGRSATGESPPLEFLEKLAQVAEGSNDPAVQLQLHYAHGNNYFWIGKQHLARQHFDAAYALIPRVDGAVLAAQYGEDGCVTTRALLAWVLWIQGDPVAAEAMSAEAVAAGRALGHAHTLGFAMTTAALLYRFLGLPERVAEICLELSILSEANGMLLWQAAAAAMLGWARATDGDEEGLALIRMGLAGAQQAMLIVETTFLAFLAESLCRLGRPDEALPVVEESIAKALLREDVYYLSEFLRLKGEIRLRVEGDEAQAEACFREGLSLARQQGARMLELRNAMSLASLLHHQGHRKAAREILAPCCEAFDHVAPYPDIAAARHLLASISTG